VLNKKPVLLAIAATFLLTAASNGSKKITGYLIDSSCAITKNLAKPVGPQCAIACARKGSPLMILGDDGTLYLPVNKTVPSGNQNPKLMKFAGQHVTVIGETFESHGAKGIQIEKIEAAK
jgi:hypothetical protein